MLPSSVAPSQSSSISLQLSSWPSPGEASQISSRRSLSQRSWLSVAQAPIPTVHDSPTPIASSSVVPSQSSSTSLHSSTLGAITSALQMIWLFAPSQLNTPWLRQRPCPMVQPSPTVGISSSTRPSQSSSTLLHTSATGSLGLCEQTNSCERVSQV